MSSSIPSSNSFRNTLPSGQSTQAPPSTPTAPGSNTSAQRQHLQSFVPPNNIWTLRQPAPANHPGHPGAPAELNPHSFTGPSFNAPLPQEQQNSLNQHQVIEMLNRICMQLVVDAEVKYAHAEHATTNPHGARRLIYRSVKKNPPQGLEVTLHIDDGNRLSRMEVQPIHNGLVMPQLLQASFSSPATERPATPAGPRAAWTHALYQTIPPHSAVHGRSNSNSPIGAPPRQRSRIDSGVHQQAITAAPGPQPMDQLCDFHQTGLQHLKPERLAQTVLVPKVYYGEQTVNGPHYDERGRPNYYLEQQIGHSCAQHAVNAMIGGPYFSLHEFVMHEHVQQSAGTSARSLSAVHETITDNGVPVSSVVAVLQEAKIESTSFHHTPTSDLFGDPVLDWQQLEQIDQLDAERFVLHYSALGEEERTGAIRVLISHFVAFRRLPQTREWWLLDSQEASPRAITPSAYLREQAQEVQGKTSSLNDITVIVPQRRLALPGETAGGTGMASGSGANVGQAARVLQTPGAGPSSGAAIATEQPRATTRRLEFQRMVFGNTKRDGKDCTIYYKDGNGKKKRKQLFLKKFNDMNALEEAAMKTMTSIKDGTFEPPTPRKAAQHPSPRKGVNWVNEYGSVKAHWHVELNGVEKNFYPHNHNNDVAEASRAAVELADEIEANPDISASKHHADLQSIVTGVIWSSKYNCWLSKSKEAFKYKYFVSKNEEDRNTARIQAESLALSEGASPRFRQPDKFAPEGLDNVPPITWNTEKMAFVVNDKDQPVEFKVADHNNDVLAARTAAENRAIEIAQQRPHEEEAGPSQVRKKRSRRKK